MGLASPHPLDVNATAAWLVDGARSASSSGDVLAELCARLVDDGLPLWRVAVFVHTLHPEIMGRRFLWRPGAEVAVGEASFDFVNDASYLASPVVRVQKTGQTIRRRLADPECPLDFPFLAEMREEAGSDYLAMPLRFTNDEIHTASFTKR